MLRMPVFQVHRPSTAAEAVAMRTSLPNSAYLAGGTDLLPNLKHGLGAPDHLISLADVPELSQVEVADDSLRIGAGATLHTVATHPLVLLHAPALALAASTVAGPQHRRMGTLGGNVMLDTRCLYYNQSEMWRRALGHCLKADGDWCHVVGSHRSCVAAQSSDCVPALIAMSASLHLGSNPHHLDISAMYRNDGVNPHTVPDTALLTHIVIPLQPNHRGTYRKVRARAAIDFPQLGVAAVAHFNGDKVTLLRLVVGAVMPKPKLIRGTDSAVGTRLDDATIEDIATTVYKQVRPQATVHGAPSWRRHMAQVEAREALRALRHPT